MESIRDGAIKIREQGLSVFSTKVDKTPVVRKANRIVELRTNLPTKADIDLDFSHANVAGIAVNCGPVAGQNRDLECLDIDCPILAKHFMQDLEVSNKYLHDKLTGCVEETPSEGLHIFYYTPIGKSKCRELANMSSDRAKAWLTEARVRGSKKTTAPPLIETKGAGGYVVGFYSQAISKIDGIIKPYKMLHGGISTIPELTNSEHEFLMAFSQSYDEKAVKKFKTVNPEPIYRHEVDKKTALEQWRVETPWTEILPDSYRIIEVRPDYFICWHPDSSDMKTPNALCGAKAGGMDRYWSFSPNDWRLPSNTPLTKDYVYCASRGWVAGSKEWKSFYSQVFDKYCTARQEDLPDESRWDLISEDNKKADKKIKVKKQMDIVPDESIDFPGWINSYIDYCMRNALYPEKRIAAASALGMFSALVGRSVMGPGELKLNLYMVILGLTANGKDYPRKLNARICMEIDSGDLLLTKVGSREGLEERVMQGPKFLMADEGAFDLEKVKNGDTRYNDVMGSMLELFTSNYIKRRVRAGEDQEENFIRYPFLSVMTSSTPEEYFKALSPKVIRSGFYNRLLILQAAVRGRMNVHGMCSNEPIPRELVETAARLIAMNENMVAGGARAFIEENGIDEFGNEPLNKVENEPRILELSDDALEFFQEEVWKNDDLYSEYQKKGEEEKAASCARLPEQALKISCLWELSRDIRATHISLEAIMSGFKFVREVNKRQTANTVMVSDTKFGEITDKLLKLIEENSTDIDNGNHGIKMKDAKRILRKNITHGQSVDDAIRYLQDCGEITIKKTRDANGHGEMYITTGDQQSSQPQPSEPPIMKG